MTEREPSTEPVSDPETAVASEAAGATAGSVDRPETAAPGMSPRPPFAAGWPRDEELDRLLAYLARGNHQAVRTGAEALAAKTTDPEVAAAARELRRRIEPDPIAKVLLGTTFVLLMVLTAWAMRRTRDFRALPPPPAPQVQIVK